MKWLLLFAIAFSLQPAVAQQQTYDLLTFTPPAGWDKREEKNTIAFSTTDTKTRTWCMISIVRSTNSKGSIENDFDSEWQEFAVKTYGAGAPLAVETQDFQGWKIKSGSGKFLFNKDSATILLTSFSNGQRCMSVMLMSNTAAYGKKLDEFIASINVVSAPVSEPAPGATKSAPVNTGTKNTGFQFFTTNFDNGWVSIIKDDWVEVTKGAVIVRLHYPDPANIIAADPAPHIAHAWNKLVAPRYSDIQDYKTASPSLDWQRAYLGTATLVNKSGRRVYVALFKKATDWIEIETPDKATFVKEFNLDPDVITWDSDSDIWKTLLTLPGYNRFAVGEKDLSGKWSSDFSGSMQYYNVFTGAYAGYNAHQSNEAFTFGPGNNYHWKLLSVQTSNFNINAQQAESNGTMSFKGNWQLAFSKIEKGPKTYDVYFSAIKGGRVLWMQRTDIPGYTAYGKSKD